MVHRGRRVLAFAPALSSKDLRLLAHLGAEPYSLPPQLVFWDKYRRMRELSTIVADAGLDAALVQPARNGAASGWLADGAVRGEPVSAARTGKNAGKSRFPDGKSMPCALAGAGFFGISCPLTDKK